MVNLYSTREIAGFRHRRKAGDNTEVIIFKSRFHNHRVAVVREDKNRFAIYAMWRDDQGVFQRESYPKEIVEGRQSTALKRGREILKKILLITGEWYKVS